MVITVTAFQKFICAFYDQVDGNPSIELNESEMPPHNGINISQLYTQGWLTRCFRENADLSPDCVCYCLAESSLKYVEDIRNRQKQNAYTLNVDANSQISNRRALLIQIATLAVAFLTLVTYLLHC